MLRSSAHATIGLPSNSTRCAIELNQGASSNLGERDRTSLAAVGNPGATDLHVS